MSRRFVGKVRRILQVVLCVGLSASLTLVYRKQTLSFSALGCYQGGSSRAFSAASLNTGTLTLSSCAEFCSNKGFMFFGVEYKREVRSW